MYTPDPPPISAGNRLGAMLLDHFFLSVILFLLALPSLISSIAAAFRVAHEPASGPGFFEGSGKYLLLTGLALYFCKDSFNGRSIAKRLLKQQVVENRSGAPATPLRCLLRNLFCVVWPIEVLVTLGSPQRRLGDRVAGTRVIAYRPAAEKAPARWPQVALAFGLALLFLLGLGSVLPALPKNASAESFSPRSYNPAKSRALEKLFTDSLGAYLHPDIRVYDSTSGNARPFVSLILHLHHDYLSDENDKRAMKESTEALVYSVYPKAGMSGRVQYVYQAEGSFHSSTNNLGQPVHDAAQR